MSEERKSLKQYCKEAKKRLKQGFWKNYQENLDKELIRAEMNGISTSKVKEYYSQRVATEILNDGKTQDEFYEKVKKILDTEGEVSDIIGRLTDKKEFDSLSYEEKQKYTLKLSERYILALEKYKKEKYLSIG